MGEGKTFNIVQHADVEVFVDKVGLGPMEVEIRRCGEEQEYCTCTYVIANQIPIFPNCCRYISILASRYAHLET